MSIVAPRTVHVCPCTKGEDGKYRFVCVCGWKAEAPETATGCPSCGVDWTFDKDVVVQV